jgi:hypothetical protein
MPHGLVCQAYTRIGAHHTSLYTGALDNGKNIPSQTRVGEQAKKSRQFGSTGFLVVMTVIVSVAIVGVSIEPGPKIVEQSRRSVEREAEAAKLNVTRLLGQHDFEKFEVIGLSVKAVYDGGEKNRGAIAGRQVGARPADIFVNELRQILKLDGALRERSAIDAQHGPNGF